MGYYSQFSDPKRRRKLSDIVVEEISIVDKAATGAHFAIVKADAGLDEALKEFLGDFDIDKDEAEAAAAVTKALALLAKYKEDFPDDVMKAIKTLAAFAGSGSDYGYPEKKPKEVKKGSGFPWPSFRIQRGGFVRADDNGGDDTEPPPRRALSKQARDVVPVVEPDLLWPSLA